MKKIINRVLSILYKLLVVTVGFVVAMLALLFVLSWLFFSGDRRLNKVASPEYQKDAYHYVTAEKSRSGGPPPYSSYYLIKTRTFTSYWKTPAYEDAFFAGHCNALVGDEKRMTWSSENQLEFYCHIRSCESIVRILPSADDVKIHYIIEQDNREKRNCLTELLSDEGQN